VAFHEISFFSSFSSLLLPSLLNRSLPRTMPGLQDVAVLDKYLADKSYIEG